MDQSFAQLVSSTGCFAVRSGAAYIQREQQSYAAYSVHQVDVSRRSIVREVLRAKKLDRVLRAKIECFLFRALTPSQWARVTRLGIDKVVKQYAEAIHANAALHMSVISASAANHEKELEHVELTHS